MKGWIKLYRRLLDNMIFDNPELLKVWIWCLLKATHKEYIQLVGLQEVKLREGEFIFGRAKAAHELNMTQSKIYRLIKKLEKMQNVNIKTSNKYSVVTIVNWNLYQAKDNEFEQENERQMNSKRITNEQQMNTNKNNKNDEEDIYILTYEETHFLEILGQIENYPLDRKKDIEMYHTLEKRYPELDILDAIEDFKQYKLDRPLKENSNPRSQINTSFRNYVKWNKCLKSSKRSEPQETKNWRGSDKRL